MNQPKPFEIRIWRLPLFLLFLAGLFFFFSGLEIGFLHKIIPAFEISSDKQIIFWLFEFFFVGFGGLIAIQMLIYLIKPPVMFQADEKGIYFACGFRYNLSLIEWRHFEEIKKIGIDKAMLLFNKKLMMGLQITFKKSDQIPMLKATSIGVSYFNYCLTLNWFYMNKSATEAKNQIEEFIRNQKS